MPKKEKSKTNLGKPDKNARKKSSTVSKTNLEDEKNSPKTMSTLFVQDSTENAVEMSELNESEVVTEDVYIPGTHYYICIVNCSILFSRTSHTGPGHTVISIVDIKLVRGVCRRGSTWLW